MVAQDNTPEDGREKPFDPFGDDDDKARLREEDGSLDQGEIPEAEPADSGADDIQADDIEAEYREDADGFREEVAQLDLGDEDTRLPWLEGDDDEDEYEGYNNGQILGLIFLGLIALGLIVGGIWWATRDKPDAGLVADGGTIEAPDEPYKTKPENPGGEVVSGTGDTSYAVAEGQSRQVQIGQDEPPKPGFDTMDDADDTAAAPAAAPAAPETKAPSTPAPAPSASSSSGSTSGVGVQVGAYSTRDAAEKGWNKLVQQSDALSGVSHRIVQGQADIGTVYRLQAVAGTKAAADAMCAKLKAANIGCQVKP